MTAVFVHCLRPEARFHGATGDKITRLFHSPRLCLLDTTSRSTKQTSMTTTLLTLASADYSISHGLYLFAIFGLAGHHDGHLGLQAV
jgi:hypothetical protein